MPPVIAAAVAIGSYLSTAVAAGIAAISAFTGLSPFLIQAIGALIIGIGIQLITSLFVKKPNPPTTEAGKINVRISEPERWLGAGRARMGGGILFAEYDSSGNFWYLVVHCDSILTSIEKIYFDDVAITVVNSEVTNNEFSLDNKFNSYNGTGTRRNCFNIWTTTYNESNPLPPAITQFKAAFPTLWTDDHKLVGTTYSVVKITSLSAENRGKIYRWRGPIGVGEPSVSIVGNWSNTYDPRDVNQFADLKSTHKFTGNPALIWAWFRVHKYGRDKAISTINWERLKEQANICDALVTDISGNNIVRYRCGIAIPESKERHVAEQEILMACDAQLVFDDDGKVWPRVGYYYAPSLNLVRNRDIVAMESVEAQNGESMTQGVIVRYIDPDANYSAQSSAPWLNPFYYRENETPKFITIDALTIQDHNQAMRLAKSIGLRSQSQHKLLPTVGLRGLKARQERIVSLQYDNTFSGDYEIVTPVEVDIIGVFCGFGCVPINQDRFNLLSGEEQIKPERKTTEGVVALVLPTGLSTSYVNDIIKITFDPSPRLDQIYHFQYQRNTGSAAVENEWLDFSTNMTENFAISGSVAVNATYYIRYRTRLSSGLVSVWANLPDITTSRIILTGTPNTTANVGIAYSSFTVSATGGKSPYLFTDVFNRLPVGITINSSTGVVSGTPTTAGTRANIIIRVTDADSYSVDFPAFTIIVSP